MKTWSALCDAFADQRIATGGSFRFIASERCTFTLAGGGATITDDGLFRAPSTAGTFAVRIASETDPTRAKTVKVTVAPATLHLVAGGFGGEGHSDGVGAEVAFERAEPVARDGKGNLFVGERLHIRKIELATRTVSTVTTLPGGEYSRAGVETLTVTDDGTIYFTRSDSTAIWKVAPSSSEAVVLAGKDGDFGTADGDVATARFGNLLFLTSDGKQTLWVADSNNQLLRRIDLATRNVTTVAGSTSVLDPIDGIGTAAGFIQSHAIAWDPTGVVWIADDAKGHHLRRFDPRTAEVKTIVTGTAGMPFAPIIQGIASDGATVYVGDALGLVRVDLATRATTRIASTFGGRFALEGGRLIAGAGPHVRAYELSSGTIDTIAGNLEARGYADGPGLSALFANASDLAIVGGAVLVADSGNGFLRRFDPASAVVSSFLSVPCAGEIIDDRRGGLFLPSCPTLQRVDVSTKTLSEVAGLTGQLVDVAPDGTRFTTALQPDGTHRMFVVAASGSATPLPFVFRTLGGVVGDGVGHVFVSAVDEGTIHRIDLATNKDEVLAGAVASFDIVDGARGASRLRAATSLVYDGRGGLLFADGTSNRDAIAIRKMDTVTGEVTTVVGTKDRSGLRAGPLPSTVMGAHGLAVAPNGELYFLEHGALMHVDTPL